MGFDRTQVMVKNHWYTVLSNFRYKDVVIIKKYPEMFQWLAKETYFWQLVSKIMNASYSFVTYLSNNLSHKKDLSQLKILFLLQFWVQKKNVSHTYQPTYFDLTFKPPATKLKFLLTDLRPFQYKWPLGVCLDVLRRERIFLYLWR